MVSQQDGLVSKLTDMTGFNKLPDTSVITSPDLFHQNEQNLRMAT